MITNTQLQNDGNTRFDVSERFISNLNRERELRGENPVRYRIPAMLDQSSARSAFVLSVASGLALLGVGLLGYKAFQISSKK